MTIVSLITYQNRNGNENNRVNEKQLVVYPKGNSFLAAFFA